MTRSLWSAAVLGLLLVTACGQGRTGTDATPTVSATPAVSVTPTPGIDRAARWVERMGGTVGSEGTAWVADRETWRRSWPWPSDTAVVNCAVAPAGNTYVELDDRTKYVLTSSAGLSSSLYEGDAFAVARDKTAALAWAERARAVCRGRG